MKLGFTINKPDIGPNEVRYGIPVQPPHTSQGVNVGSMVKVLTGVLGALVLLGGLVWGAAFMFAGMASDDDLDAVEDRVELVEKNDIRQTLILEQIKEAVEKIDEKLDGLIGKE